MPAVAKKKPSLLPPSILGVTDDRGAACSAKTFVKDSIPRMNFGCAFSDGERVTVYDIAGRVGVSHTIVARALGKRKKCSGFIDISKLL